MRQQIGFIFPGQGSQYVGMGRELFEHSEAARDVFSGANKALGWDVSKLCFEGPEDQLNQTEFTQPALLVTSVAAWRALGAETRKGSLVAGHSLGEYSALVAAGAISFSDAVRVTQRRGAFMQEAVPKGRGAMAAIVGLNRKQVEEVCKEASGESGVVAPANYNGPDQVVIAGETESVQRAIALASKRGAKRVVPLTVSVPSHSPMMEPACDRLAAELEKIEGRDLEIPLVNNLRAKKITTWREAKEGLIRQLASPLLWEETIRTMRDVGVGIFIEVGPSRVLSGLLRRIDRQIPSMNVEDPAGVEKVLEYLRSEPAK